MSSSPYHNAGWLLNEHLEKRRGLKSIAFDNTGKKKNKAPDKATYATVCKTMQHLSTINEILNANNKKLRKAIGFDAVRNKGLLYVMLYELLFGKYKSIRGGGKIKRMIVKHEKELRREVDEYVAKHGGVGGEGEGGGKVTFPRYIRVNTLKADAADIVAKLKEDLDSKNMEEDKSHDKSDELSSTIYVDSHVPDLLVLPPTASSWLHHDYDPVKNGNIVLQDKSSCFSALTMVHGLGVGNNNPKLFDYIDACSAPGNKTSHLAALVNSTISSSDSTNLQQPNKNKKKGKKDSSNATKSTIFAFERSSDRFKILQGRMELLVPPPTTTTGNNNTATNNTTKKPIAVAVEPTHGDFLKAGPTDPQFANVHAIMLDPSCSGSGIVNSPDRWMEDDGDKGKDKKRIQSLSNFQLVALKHAMSFPNVDRIVYSTCSVHDEENEAVVAKALSEVEKPEDENEEWALMAPVCLEHWTRRGKEGGIGGLTKEQADCLIRCDGLDGDETNGFFVSFFVRKKLLLGSAAAKQSQKAIENVGVPVYNGQFADLCNKAAATAADVALATTTSNSQEAEQTTSVKNEKPQKKAKKKNDSSLSSSSTKASATDDKRSAKKREKKLAWKRKQALLRAERLKKKEDKASSS